MGLLTRLGVPFSTNILPRRLKIPCILREAKNQTYFLLCTQNREEPKIKDAASLNDGSAPFSILLFRIHFLVISDFKIVIFNEIVEWFYILD